MSQSSATRSARLGRQLFAALRHLDPTARLIFFGLAFLSIGFISSLAWSSLSPLFRVHQLTLVAGSRDGESFILSQAIEKVVEAHDPNIQIQVVETSGTEENIQKLESGEAQLVTAQADVPAGPSARTVVLLYADTFQLVVKDNAPIQQFSDLKGKRIGLWQRAGSTVLFWKLLATMDFKSKTLFLWGATNKRRTMRFGKTKWMPSFGFGH